MPPSQLKRLKASLRNAGVTGQQKPKKAKNKRDQKNGDFRMDRTAALESIREEFNPFEVKKTREKHTIIGAKRVKGKEGRPTLSKQIGEENRKRTLLVEMQRKHKAGGIIDRRFGENDPTMAPEDRMLERFTREQQRRNRAFRGEMFNIDDDDEGADFDGLTHFGQSLGGVRDDFDATGLPSDGDSEEGPTVASRKRFLEQEEANDEGGSDLDDGQPQRKKSKAEVMKEVISKSKLHKYDRQQMKEADEQERKKLDDEMGDLWCLLGARQPSTTGAASGANNIPLGESTSEVDRSSSEKPKPDDYDKAVREMMFDKRSKPSDRSKTAEELAEEESECLKELEEARQRRMRGEESEDEVSGHKKPSADDEERNDGEDGEEGSDSKPYGLGAGALAPSRSIPDFNPDELVDGDYEYSEDGYVDVNSDGEIVGEFSDDFKATGSLTSDAEFDDEDSLASVKDDATVIKTSDNKLAFTFPCPQTHKELLAITKDIPVSDHPTVVQRIRVLHHSNLAAGNKEKLGIFATVLLEHIQYLAYFASSSVPFATLDLLIRHLHALAKTYPELVATAFREHLKTIHASRINSTLNAGDLLLLTAVGTIFSASDHFHQVVTPAHIIICKWLSQVAPATHRTLAIGSYLITLLISYQRISKRYVPEAINFLLQALYLLAPTKPDSEKAIIGNFPVHETDALRIQNLPKDWALRKPSFADIFGNEPKSDMGLVLLYTTATQLSALSTLWVGKRAFIDVFSAALPLLLPLTTKKSSTPLPKRLRTHLTTVHKTLTVSLLHAAHTLRPLELHHHRPLPIVSNIPKFESDFNPDKKSYDHDVDRREAAKLRAEIKKEKKGAMRELRKDGAFVSRVKLQQSKEESAAYHKKMAGLVASVQTQEGQAANEYEREKRLRKRK